MVVWLGVIAVTSGEIGAHSHSDVWVWRAIHQWLPWLFGTETSSSTPTFLPTWVRKLAHFAEYAVLGAVVARALQRSPSPHVPGSPGKGRLPGVLGLPPVVTIGLPFCGAVAIIDELHQRTLVSRTGSPRDVAFDVVGAAVGLVVGGLVWRRSVGG